MEDGMRAKKISISLLVLVLVLVTVVVCMSAGKTKSVQAAGFGDMLKLTGANGVVIEYDQNMFDLAKQLLPEVEKRVKAEDQQSAQTKAANETLKQNYADIQKFLYSEIGVAQPKNNSLSMMLGGMPDCTIDCIVNSLPSVKHLKIYDEDALKARLANGEKIDGFQYNPSNDTLVMIPKPIICSTISINGQVTKDDSNDSNAVTILIKPGDLQDEMNQALRYLDGMVKSSSAVAKSSISSAIRLAVQAAIQTNYDINLSRRWFYEGMTNYLTARCLERFSGEGVASEYLNQYDPTQYQDLKDQVNLRKWPRGLDIHISNIDPGKLGIDLSEIGPGSSVEFDVRQLPEDLQQDIQHNLGELVGDARLHQAACCFATSEICNLANRHGADAITAIFKEIGKADEPTEQTIFDAIQKVTGEDFRAILGQYGSKAKEINTEPSPEARHGIRA
jgi:hypothetical protein